MTQKFIFEQKNLTFNAIKNAGGNKVAIICSGNRENHGLFKMIYTTTLTYHWNHVSSVYVHLITNIRKNWTTNNCMELDFHADGEGGGGRKQQHDILHNFEANQTVKLSKLTEVSAYPKLIYRKAKSFHLLTGFLW